MSKSFSDTFSQTELYKIYHWTHVFSLSLAIISDYEGLRLFYNNVTLKRPVYLDFFPSRIFKKFYTDNFISVLGRVQATIPQFERSRLYL